MKTVPLADGSGTIPLRTSKNPVLGVFRHHCGSVATVHQPKGRKAHLRYLICDECGTDQASGTPYQEKIRANRYDCIEDLEAAEQAVTKSAENELTYKVKPSVNEPVKQSLPTVDEMPPQTAKNAVVNGNEPLKNETVEVGEKNTALPVEPSAKQPLPTVDEIPPETNKNAVYTENESLKNESVKVTEPKTSEQNTVKPLRVGLSALFGAVIGGLFAMVA